MRKHWQKWVRTNFNQPMRKLRRLTTRRTKAKEVFPAPIKNLRPVVRGCTRRYNRRVREGKGFTLEELSAAKISPAFARTVGISVDHRRTNRSTESKQLNVMRLKSYKEKLVLLPRKVGQLKKGRNGTLSDTANVDATAQNQVVMSSAMPVVQDVTRQKTMAVTKEMSSFACHKQIRQEWSNMKNDGKRKKAAGVVEE